MKADLSPEEKRKIKNEVLARSTNKKLRNIIKEHTPAEELKDLAIDFYCECSDESCEARVPLTLKEYAVAHEDASKFIVAPGHQTPSIEKIEHRAPDYSIVTKPALQ